MISPAVTAVLPLYELPCHSLVATAAAITHRTDIARRTRPNRYEGVVARQAATGQASWLSPLLLLSGMAPNRAKRALSLYSLPIKRRPGLRARFAVWGWKLTDCANYLVKLSIMADHNFLYSKDCKNNRVANERRSLIQHRRMRR